MTVGSDVKQCLSSIKNVKNSLASLELRTEDEYAKQTFQETITIMEEIMDDLKKRVGRLELEEDQYRGF
ncbi:DUF1657 domain-containing protein [Alteribacillus bidgolensis]|uniref:DUF1657 domain-containing protein n=1 Tax=Alteribacillus bidgolensis TaxID=930129 RepID=A0A1G8CSX2_9BACI|nr:DUF1657 domain-containing protein [Alteribacillus bidgolensis]SDH48605.1 Protein of unknown function [Alteribacillus bidgolensis]